MRRTSRATRRGRSRARRSSRAPSMIRPNGTPDGHAVSQARQTRHASRCPASASAGGPSVDTIWRMSCTRPRGESASSSSTRYVGQSLRQRPHEMQVARSSGRTCDERTTGAVWMEMSHTIRSRMTVQTRDSVIERLRAVLPRDRVIDDPVTLEPYAYDASFWSLRMQHRPDVVIVPESTADVAAAMRVAAETGTPIVPRGAGTGQTGGAVAARGGIVVSFARMRKIVEIDRPNLQAIVEPGLVFADFQAALLPHGL